MIHAHAGRSCSRGLVALLRCAITSPRQLLAARGEPHRLEQGVSPAAKRRKGCFGFMQQLAEPRLGGLGAEQSEERRLALGLVLGHGLAERPGIALRIEQIVGELEGLAERGGIGNKRGTLRRFRAAEDGSRLAGEAEQGAGLERLHLGDVARAEVLARRTEIERLAERHALPAAGLGQQQDQLGANGRIGMALPIAQDLEGEGEQRVAGKDGGRLVEGDMQGRAAAADGVVVHRRQIVMHQRVAMHAFERASGGQGVVRRHAKHSRRFDEKKRPQPLAAAERCIAHRLGKAGTLRGVAAILGEQAVQPSPRRLEPRVRALRERPSWGKRENSGSLPQKTR